jgi:solute carrier family 36 (proton-coupled amino acid transporter)
LARSKFGNVVDDDSDEDDNLKRKLVNKTPTTARRIKQEDAVDKVDKLGPWATAFTIFKGFVASGILYMPKNFINGGYLFSALTMGGSLALTLFCAKLLLDTRAKLGGSFSEIGEKTMGRSGKIMVDVTLVGSQVSFVTAYVYFISKNIS